MLKKIFIFLIILSSITFSLTTLKISNNFSKIEEPIIKSVEQKESIKNIKTQENSINENQIGSLIIKKINLNEPLFEINSEENTVEKHLEILKESIFPNQENSIMFIAAHSGVGKIAYFERLDELEINDEIILKIDNKEYSYIVKNTWEEKKNGYINVNKESKNQLILTTCSPTKAKYQLIVNCTIKEP